MIKATLKHFKKGRKWDYFNLEVAGLPDDLSIDLIWTHRHGSHPNAWVGGGHATVMLRKLIVKPADTLQNRLKFL